MSVIKERINNILKNEFGQTEILEISNSKHIEEKKIISDGDSNINHMAGLKNKIKKFRADLKENKIDKQEDFDFEINRDILKRFKKGSDSRKSSYKEEIKENEELPLNKEKERFDIANLVKTPLNKIKYEKINDNIDNNNKDSIININDNSMNKKTVIKKLTLNLVGNSDLIDSFTKEKKTSINQSNYSNTEISSKINFVPNNSSFRKTFITNPLKNDNLLKSGTPLNISTFRKNGKTMNTQRSPINIKEINTIDKPIVPKEHTKIDLQNRKNSILIDGNTKSNIDLSETPKCEREEISNGNTSNRIKNKIESFYKDLIKLDSKNSRSSHIINIIEDCPNSMQRYAHKSEENSNQVFSFRDNKRRKFIENPPISTMKEKLNGISLDLEQVKKLRRQIDELVKDDLSYMDEELKIELNKLNRSIMKLYHKP